eukprot:Skav227580  [mRNA]  locus=scaffold517:181011:184002:+ [translate_table: standard]
MSTISMGSSPPLSETSPLGPSATVSTGPAAATAALCLLRNFSKSSKSVRSWFTARTGVKVMRPARITPTA